MSLARAALLSLPLLFLATRARGETPSGQCASAYENAQLLRQRGKLLAARDQVGVCAREQCPEIARRDCARWAEEIAREIPSVVVVVRDEADRDVRPERLLVDGVPRAEVASGRAFELDPGAHVFRVERAGAPPVEQSFTTYQGERDRVLRITAPGAPIVVPASAPARATPARVPPPSVAPASPPARPSYAPAVVVGGLSIGSLAASAYLGLTGRHQLSDLRSSCAPSCADSQVDPVRTRLAFSDVTLGVGLVGAAVAVYMFARAASEPAPASSARVEIAPMREGAAAVVSGSF